MAMDRPHWLEHDKEWYFACSTRDVPEGGARQVHVYDQEVLVIRDGDGYHATEAWCPHMFAPLVHGTIDENSKTIVCAEHAMRVNYTDGTNVCGPYGMTARQFAENWVFKTKVEGDRIYVRLLTTAEIEAYYDEKKQTVPLRLER